MGKTSRVPRICRFKGNGVPGDCDQEQIHPRISEQRRRTVGRPIFVGRPASSVSFLTSTRCFSLEPYDRPPNPIPDESFYRYAIPSLQLHPMKSGWYPHTIMSNSKITTGGHPIRQPFYDPCAVISKDLLDCAVQDIEKCPTGGSEIIIRPLPSDLPLNDSCVRVLESWKNFHDQVDPPKFIILLLREHFCVSSTSSYRPALDAAPSVLKWLTPSVPHIRYPPPPASAASSAQE